MHVFSTHISGITGKKIDNYFLLAYSLINLGNGEHFPSDTGHKKKLFSYLVPPGTA